jgi:hypothetical protein
VTSGPQSQPLFTQYEDRAAYEARQITASTGKFSYCKFGYADASSYVAIVQCDRARRRDTAPLGRVVCLGVRNGREVDLFRTVLRGNVLQRAAVQALEFRWHGFSSRLPWIESLGRDALEPLTPDACIGVEINPMARRSDIWVGSYDATPPEWDGQFGIVYSNAFDHAFDPQLVASAWRRLIRPEGGYLVLDYPEMHAATPLDPVGALTLADIQSLFPGELVYHRRRGSAWGYAEYIIRF